MKARHAVDKNRTKKLRLRKVHLTIKFSGEFPGNEAKRETQFMR